MKLSPFLLYHQLATYCLKAWKKLKFYFSYRWVVSLAGPLILISCRSNQSSTSLQNDSNWQISAGEIL